MFGLCEGKRVWRAATDTRTRYLLVAEVLLAETRIKYIGICISAAERAEIRRTVADTASEEESVWTASEI